MRSDEGRAQALRREMEQWAIGRDSLILCSGGGIRSRLHFPGECPGSIVPYPHYLSVSLKAATFVEHKLVLELVEFLEKYSSQMYVDECESQM